MKILCFTVLAFAMLSPSVFGQLGYIRTIAGNHSASFSGDGGSATDASLDFNSGIWADGSGNLYIADMGNNRIRVVNSAGVISTLAGGGSSFGDGGPATASQLNYPQGVTADLFGNVYIADQHNNRVRKVDASGIINTFVGDGTGGYSGDGGAATAAKVDQPADVATDNAGNLYIVDQNNNRIRKVDTFGIITTIAGNGTAGYSGDGGPATAAKLNWPCAVAVDNWGCIYIGDFENNRVRKINTSGIITTFAGNGTSGYSGDGGPATAAEICNHWGGVFPDLLGNVYISDRYNNVVRKVDASGIITTIAGNNTAGYSGDGGPATNAQLSGDNYVCVDNTGNLIISDQDNNVVREVQFAPSYSADSFSVYISSNCISTQITVLTDYFSAGMYVKTYYGDGAIDSTAVSSTDLANFNHSYARSGNYTIKQVLYNSGLAVDSLEYSYNFRFCNAIMLTYYLDRNIDCVFDTGDFLSFQPILTEIDSNGTAVDTISSINGFYYTANGAPGDSYTFKTISTPANMSFVCPTLGVIYDTLRSSIVGSSSLYIGMQCAASSNNFKLSSYIPKHSQDEQWGWIYVNNTLCTDDATLTMAFSPNFTMESMVTSPYVISGNTIKWNLAGDHDSIISVFFKLNSSFMMTIGDTVQNHVKVLPLDPDSLNNYMVVIDTVQAGCDPNNMWVSPSGCIPITSGSTQLQYTISFMNTGNDTAYNVYVMDTLPSNVDISSMRMVMSSANMYISKLKDTAGQNILKFDFPNINLLDSTQDLTKCGGTVIYTINTLPSLPDNTVINNKAGIYFDSNPVVMTNIVQNTVGCAVAGVATANGSASVDIFPNPANDEIALKTDPGIYSSLSITNDMGQQFVMMPIHAQMMYVNIKMLPTGLYYMTVTGDNSPKVVKKFIKE
jgi:Secretion system C-terminal sorting domain